MFRRILGSALSLSYSPPWSLIRLYPSHHQHMLLIRPLQIFFKSPRNYFFRTKTKTFLKRPIFFRPGNKTARQPPRKAKKALPGAACTLETQQPQIISRKIWHLLRSKFDNRRPDHPPLACSAHNVSQNL